MDAFFVELTIIFILVTVFAYVVNLLKLPTILAYIFTGLFIGSVAIFGDEYFRNEDALEALSKIGITLLLFILGLEMKISDLKTVGKTAVLTGIGQIVFTSIAGVAFALIIGYELREALYIAIALTFSSTIVIVKLLSDKKALNSLYGKISIGFLLVQDFVAIVALLLLNGLSNDTLSLSALGLMLIKAVVIFTVVILLSQHFLPMIVHKMANSLEILFAFSIAWAFGVAWLISSEVVGLSIEIGGFLAGLALANAVESLQIVSKIRTLRDFFIIVFFVNLGLSLQIDNFANILAPGLFFSLFILVGNPLIVVMILTMLKYKARTAFLSGLTVAQISEFSLIVIFAGLELGHVSSQTASMVTLVGVITFALSSYMIMHGDAIYKKLEGVLRLFERKTALDSEISDDGFKDHIVIIGIDQIGSAMLKALRHRKDEIIAIDFNPETVSYWQEMGYNTVFGDIAEHDVIDKGALEDAKVVISTIPTVEENLILIRRIKSVNPNVHIIINAERKIDRKVLEEAGADMVIEPFDLAGQMLSRFIEHPELSVKE